MAENCDHKKEDVDIDIQNANPPIIGNNDTLSKSTIVAICLAGAVTIIILAYLNSGLSH